MNRPLYDGTEFRQVVVTRDQLLRLRKACKANNVVLVEDVKAADAGIAKQKLPGTFIVALNGHRLRLAAARREARV